MEFCIGGDVCSMLCGLGYFEEPEALFYLAQVIFAVSYLHKRKIIHRDIKPENMLITAEGRLKLSDFGLSAVHKKETLPNIASRMTPNQVLIKIIFEIISLIRSNLSKKRLCMGVSWRIRRRRHY